MTQTYAPLLSGSPLDVWRVQRDFEQEAIAAGVTRRRELRAAAIKRGEAAMLNENQSLALTWLEDVRFAVLEEKLSARDQTDNYMAYYAPYLSVLPAAQIAIIAINEAISACVEEPYGVPWTRVAYRVGRAIIAEINRKRSRVERTTIIVPAFGDRQEYEKSVQKHTLLNRRFKHLNHQQVNWWCKKNLTDPTWDVKGAVRLGDALLWILKNVCRVPMQDGALRPGFQRRIKQQQHRTSWMIQLTRESLAVLDTIASYRERLRPKHMPMLCEPMPWQQREDANKRETIIEGGYIAVRQSPISKISDTQKAAIRAADMTLTFLGMDAATCCAWRINYRTHKIAAMVAEEGGLGIPAKEDPPQPARVYREQVSEEEFQTVRKARRKWFRDVVGMKALRKNTGELFSVVDRMVQWEQQGFEEFFFPGQLDFRGRLYFLPLFLNPQGDDLRRGLLQNARPVEPGTAGLRWLAIHAANCFGKDKLALRDRVTWARDHLRAMSRTATDPMQDDWWRQAKKPWQFLAACYSMMDPNGAGAYQMCQIDGTVNGLQHYTALGRDESAAAAVNLTPATDADAPDRAYVDVAQAASKLAAEDAARGVLEARMTCTLFDKESVKQPLMTTVYGVTDVGMRAQLFAQLKKRGIQGADLYASSQYMQKTVRRAIGTVCVKASEIMDWLRAHAREIVNKTGETVRWTAPIGLPVVQGYFNKRQIQINTIGGRMHLRVSDSDLAPALQRQMRGVAPNYIHSIDGSLNLWAAIDAREAGVAFSSNHDCFLSHAASMDRLGEIVRKRFVAMHRHHLLLHLAEEWRAFYPDARIEDPPDRGTYDIASMMEAGNAFS